MTFKRSSHIDSMHRRSSAGLARTASRTRIVLTRRRISPQIFLPSLLQGQPGRGAVDLGSRRFTQLFLKSGSNTVTYAGSQRFVNLGLPQEVKGTAELVKAIFLSKSLKELSGTRE